MIRISNNSAVLYINNVALLSLGFQVHLIPPVHKCTIGMSTLLHQTQPQVATQDHIHQTPDLNQRHMKHNLAVFHIDLRYV